MIFGSEDLSSNFIAKGVHQVNKKQQQELYEK